MLTINIITLLPQVFTNNLQCLPFKRAIDKGIIKVNLINLRDFAVDKRGTVDDTPYGGGVGMILMIEPIYKALKSLYGDSLILTSTGIKLDSPNKRIVVLTTHGQTYTQQKAKEFSHVDELTFICGRYEGIDARVEQFLATDLVSVGNFVVSGGEVPALLVMESVTRLLPGVLEKEAATEIESFSPKKGVGDAHDTRVEYPQYTRPEEFMGLKVPEVLLNGNHKLIQNWREKNSQAI
jgi:tRNA (guanine37-N1)-methyltransferase